MSDVSTAPSLAVIGSMELFERSTSSVLDRRRMLVRGREVQAMLIAAGGRAFWGISRSGGRRIFAHSIDYRANVDALVELGVRDVVSTGMVGSLRESIPVGSLLLADQFLDFTTLTPHTYFEDEQYRDFDFSFPYCSRLGDACAAAAANAAVSVGSQRICYVGSDGPRFETAAEVRAFGALGGDVVGMTGVAECICARERGLCFASLVGVVNMGAGLSHDRLHGVGFLQQRERLSAAMADDFASLPQALAALNTTSGCVLCTEASADDGSVGLPASADAC